jgi:predicted nuclease with TOPRIM domain
MKTTLNTIGIVENIMELIEGNKKNAVVNSILTKSFLNGHAFETLVEMLSEREIQNIRKEINEFKKTYEVSEYYENTEEIEEELNNKNEENEELFQNNNKEITIEKTLKENNKFNEVVSVLPNTEGIKFIEKNTINNDFLMFKKIFNEKTFEI